MNLALEAASLDLCRQLSAKWSVSNDQAFKKKTSLPQSGTSLHQVINVK